jgi:hypothetical protein
VFDDSVVVAPFVVKRISEAMVAFSESGIESYSLLLLSDSTAVVTHLVKGVTKIFMGFG